MARRGSYLSRTVPERLGAPATPVHVARTDTATGPARRRRSFAVFVSATCSVRRPARRIVNVRRPMRRDGSP